MWPELPLPIIFAHRGASASAPENTFSAFQLAQDIGTPAVEFDVKLTRDGEVVIIHDQRVDRTTDGRGFVHDLPLAALRELDAGGWFDQKFNGEKIPLLDETFETFGKKLYINVELTNYATPGDDLVPRVVEIIRRHKMQQSVLFSSFLLENLGRAQELLPEVPRGLLIPPSWPGRHTRHGNLQSGNYQAVHPFWFDATTAFIGNVHSIQRRINVWTVNQKFLMKCLFNKAVDGIFTNYPALALRILEGKG